MRFEMFKATTAPQVCFNITMPNGRQAQEWIKLTEEEFAVLTSALVEKLSTGINNVIIFTTEQ